MCAKTEAGHNDLKVVDRPQDDATSARICITPQPRLDQSLAGSCNQKKRRTRRGKSKRKNNPYRKRINASKPEAPYNSNRFLIEDHGDLKQIDEELCRNDLATTSGDFYTCPYDEEVFSKKDFNEQYESLQAEWLQAMSKDELIEQFLLLKGRAEVLTDCSETSTTQMELQRLIVENECLRCENETLKTKLTLRSDSDNQSSSSRTSSRSNSSRTSSRSNSSGSSRASKTSIRKSFGTHHI